MYFVFGGAQMVQSVIMFPNSFWSNEALIHQNKMNWLHHTCCMIGHEMKSTRTDKGQS
jgi:hypothetical protein